MPKNFISKDGFGITAAARRYLAPLIQGEAPPPYGPDGLPVYVTLKNASVPKKLKKFKIG
jgi:6-phosphofructokinase 1